MYRQKLFLTVLAVAGVVSLQAEDKPVSDNAKKWAKCAAFVSALTALSVGSLYAVTKDTFDTSACTTVVLGVGAVFSAAAGFDCRAERAKDNYFKVAKLCELSAFASFITANITAKCNVADRTEVVAGGLLYVAVRSIFEFTNWL